jgi:hypothetical protein
MSDEVQEIYLEIMQVLLFGWWCSEHPPVINNG